MKLLPLLALLLTTPALAASAGAGVAEGITALLAVELAKSPALEVLSSRDLRRVVELEGEKQVMGCADDSCLAEVAGALGARFVVFGDIARVGEQLVMTLTLFDSDTGASAGRAVRTSDAAEGLLAEVGAAAREIVGPALFGVAPGAKEKLLVLDLKPPADAPVAAAGNPNGALGVVIMIVGGAAIVSGGVYDVLAPTSNNERLDAEDFISVALIGGGIGVGVAGLLLMGGE